MKQYPPDIRVKLAILPLSMRMAGPREALWHAVIRRNYGSSYFIIGRDYAGPSTMTFKGERFYGPYDAHKLVEKYEDKLGITILFSKMIYQPTGFYALKRWMWIGKKPRRGGLEVTMADCG